MGGSATMNNEYIYLLVHVYNYMIFLPVPRNIDFITVISVLLLTYKLSYALRE